MKRSQPKVNYRVTSQTKNLRRKALANGTIKVRRDTIFASREKLASEYGGIGLFISPRFIPHSCFNLLLKKILEQ
jgi:hypothetical protein